MQQFYFGDKNDLDDLIYGSDREISDDKRPRQRRGVYHKEVQLSRPF